MGSSSTRRGSPATAGARLKTTRWTLVRNARHRDPATAAGALAQLCRDYWYPLYAYIRKRGYSPEDAQDLTQEFFARLIKNHSVQQADQARGRFRSFLLSSLDNFLCNEWEKQKAIKRGGQCFFVSWDELRAEARYGQEPCSDLSAEKLYERRWATTLLDKTKAALRREHEIANKLAEFDTLVGFLSGTRNAEPYKKVAARLNLTEDTIRMRVHRLKQRFGQLLRQEVADTVDAEELDDEMQHLFTLW
jgi:RNA polymerase sigma factor (sigma-70 family)